jgi:plastocyanin
MKTKSTFIVISVLMVTVYLMGLLCAAEEKKEEIEVVNKIVAISTDEGLIPANLDSKPGTTVIWVNHSKTPVEILFLDKKVVLACSSPVNFFVGKDGGYESGKLPFGGTASLCFTEKGTYKYMLKASSTFYPLQPREHRGIIMIK